VLSGDTSEADILQAVDLHGPFDGAWVISHADETAIQLSGGEFIPHSTLAIALASAGCTWIVLNACRSEGGALQYTSRGLDVVAVEQGAGGAIDDRDAWRMGVLLAQALSDSESLGDAFDRVRGNDSRYRFYSGAIF